MGGLLVAGYVVGGLVFGACMVGGLIFWKRVMEGVVRGIGIVVVCHYRLILLYNAIAANCIKVTLTWF